MQENHRGRKVRYYLSRRIASQRKRLKTLAVLTSTVPLNLLSSTNQLIVKSNKNDSQKFFI